MFSALSGTLKRTMRSRARMSVSRQQRRSLGPGRALRIADRPRRPKSLTAASMADPKPPGRFCSLFKSSPNARRSLTNARRATNPRARAMAESKVMQSSWQFCASSRASFGPGRASRPNRDSPLPAVTYCPCIPPKADMSDRAQ